MAATLAALGLKPMKWQRDLLDVAFEVDPDTGDLAYHTVIIELMRQVGKTSTVFAAMVFRCDPIGSLLVKEPWPYTAPQQTVFSSSTAQSAREKMLVDFVGLLEAAPKAMRKRVRAVRKSNGSERLVFTAGQLSIVPPNRTAGRGKSIDMAVLDEAMAHVDDEAEAAIAPTMITRKSAQLWIPSSAGTVESAYFADKVALGRSFVEAGRRDGVCFVSYGAREGDEPGDPETWRHSIPALNQTISERAIAAQWDAAKRSPSGIATFAREYLSVWAEGSVACISPTLWREARCVDPPKPTRLALAVELDLDRETACIALAGSLEGSVMLEVVDRRPGTGWVVERLTELWTRYRPQAIVVDAGGPAAALIPDAAPFAPDVVRATTREVAQASGGFFDALTAGSLAIVADDALDAASVNTRRRTVGGSWLFDRRQSPRDASPLIGVVLARWGLVGLERPRARIL